MATGFTRGFFFAGAIAMVAHSATATTLVGGGGFDYQAGPEAQSYRSALLFSTVDAPSGDLTVAAIRFDDSRLGYGTGLFANAGLSGALPVGIRAVGVRTLGDNGFDAWRLRVGPEVGVGSDVKVGAYYLRLHNDAPENMNGGGVEVSVPLATAFTAQVGSSYGEWSGGETTAQGTLAGTWRAQQHVQLLFEVDVGRNVTTTSTQSPSGGGILGGLPIAGPLGGGSSSTQTTTEKKVSATGQLGIRFLIP